jgi:hypothetical protein
MKRLYSIIILILFFSNILLSSTISDKKNIKILNIINHQRMLSQKITKDYLYAKNKINIYEANQEISRSLKDFNSSYQQINNLTKNKKIKKAMYFVKNSSIKFSTLSNQPLNEKNMKSILNLSESILSQTEQIISLLKKDIHNNNSKFIIKSGQQEMLAQRIAKYYIAYQSNKNENSKINMKKNIELFAKNHEQIMRYKGNNHTIRKKIKEIDKSWSIAKNFYVKIEESGDFPITVFETTNNITQKMNDIIKQIK